MYVSACFCYALPDEHGHKTSLAATTEREVEGTVYPIQFQFLVAFWNFPSDLF